MNRPWAGRIDSVARTLEIFSDPWTFVVLREAFFGVRRFDDLQRNLDISRNVLTKRLKHLVEQGIFERLPYQSNPPRFEYRLTEKGLGMYPIFLAIMRWGDDWLAGEQGPPLLLEHELCGRRTRAVVTCESCGEPLRAREMRYRTGPGSGSSDPEATKIPLPHNGKAARERGATRGRRSDNRPNGR